MTLPKETTMIERLARSIFAIQYPDGTSWDDWASHIERNPDSYDGRNRSRHIARAVLTALREPSDAMLQAAYDACPPAGTPLSDDSLNIARWQAMLSAALNEGEG